MHELEQLSGLVGAIYDTVLNESLWPDVLKKVAGFVGGPNAALVQGRRSGDRAL
jgi:hypothetical protein